MKERFRQFRESQKLSQGKLAEFLGCSQQKVYGIEKGMQSPNVDDLVKLATLGLDIHWLLTGAGSMVYSRELINKEVKAIIRVLEGFIS